MAEGKARQKRRTRAAILAAAQGLMSEGGSPSMAEIAEVADVSRRTLYQHFPTLDQLLLDAAIGQLSQHDIDAAIEAADPGGTDAQARVAGMVAGLSSVSEETMELGRAMVRLTLSRPSGSGPRRGQRRVEWIEQALAPLRDRLASDTFERLVSGLSMVVGWEALSVLDDVRGLDPDQRTQVSTWAARAMIDAALAEPR